MLDNLLFIAFGALLTGVFLGTLIGTEVYKRSLTRHLVARTLEPRPNDR